MRNSVAPSMAETSTAPGTLMWIGDCSSAEFQDAYRFCEANVAALATRRNVDEAIARPASSVRRILLAQKTRQPLLANKVDRLVRAYPQATWLELKGPLCDGYRLGQNQSLQAERCFWHQWNQLLPKWLQACGASAVIAREQAASVAVIAGSVAQADPLMELIVSQHALAIWCRGPDAFRVRGVDAVWWDDSVATPKSSLGWQKRIAACGTDAATCQHTWLVSSPCMATSQQAKRGGVNFVVSKPFNIDCLVAMLASKQSKVQREPSPSEQSLYAA